MKERPAIGFIGAGRVATALARGFSAAGYTVTAISSRGSDSARELAARIPESTAGTNQNVVDSSDLVFITTPDDVIEAVTRGLRWRAGAGVVHTSGMHSRSLLRVAANAGALAGSLHPLQTFAARDDESPISLAGTVFAVEADDGLRDTLLTLVKAVQGTPVALAAEDKALYHAAAVLASNYVVTLMALATGLWSRFGVSVSDATAALLPLLNGATANIETVGLPGALTGPIARGDAETVRLHLEALRERAPDVLESYVALGKQTVPVAVAQGLDYDRAGTIEALLKDAATA